jgi:hypothetical protein
MLAQPGSSRSFGIVCSEVVDLCVGQFVCRFCRVLTVWTRKCNFTDELKSKLLFFRNCRDEWEAQCMVCKQGTYVSVANKGAFDFRVHVECEDKKAVRGETSSAKVVYVSMCVCHTQFK